MQDAPKTTLTDLSAATNSSQTGVNALLEGTAEHKTNLRRRVAEAMRTAAPAIGQYWAGQGGFYAGIMRDGDRQWHLILAAELVDATADNSKPRTGKIESKWGTYGETIPGEFSRRDGQHNTALILAAEPDNKIASHFTALLIDGHKDFYWPSQFEQNLCCINLQEHFISEWHWSSTQFSAHGAWDQHFEDGYQYVGNKSHSLAARAVRRLIIE